MNHPSRLLPFMVLSGCLLVGGPSLARITRAKAESKTESAKSKPISWRTGKEFEQTLTSTVTGAWRFAEFRPALNQIRDNYRVSIVLDRRIDPNQSWTFQASQQELGSFFKEIANARDPRQEAWGVIFIAHTIHLGPRDATDRLRTLIELRKQELVALSSRLDKKAVSSVHSRYTRAWDDLREPRELLSEWSRQRGVEVANPELVEFDLWASGAFPQSTYIEAISLLLNQFDLTFRWVPRGDKLSIELIDIPEDVSLEQSARLKLKSLDDARTLLKERFPRVELVSLDGRQLTLKGRVEEIEAAFALLDPRSTSSTSTSDPKPNGKVALSRRRFTLTVKNASISSLISRLRDEGIDIEYDEVGFRDAEIDLTQVVSFSVKEADAETLFRQIFRKLPVAVEIDDDVVSLRVDFDAEVEKGDQ